MLDRFNLFFGELENGRVKCALCSRVFGEGLGSIFDVFRGDAGRFAGTEQCALDVGRYREFVGAPGNFRPRIHEMESTKAIGSCVMHCCTKAYSTALEEGQLSRCIHLQSLISKNDSMVRI